MQMYKVMLKNKEGKVVYKTNEMSGSTIQYEIDWLTRNVNQNGLTIIVKPIKEEKQRREDFLNKLKEKEDASKEVNLDDLDKFKI